MIFLISTVFVLFFYHLNLHFRLTGYVLLGGVYWWLGDFNIYNICLWYLYRCWGLIMGYIYFHMYLFGIVFISNSDIIW
jgi:hypothetical protein